MKRKEGWYWAKNSKGCVSDVGWFVVEYTNTGNWYCCAYEVPISEEELIIGKMIIAPIVKEGVE